MLKVQGGGGDEVKAAQGSSGKKEGRWDCIGGQESYMWRERTAPHATSSTPSPPHTCCSSLLRPFHRRQASAAVTTAVPASSPGDETAASFCSVAASPQLAYGACSVPTPGTTVPKVAMAHSISIGYVGARRVL